MIQNIYYESLILSIHGGPPSVLVLIVSLYMSACYLINYIVWKIFALILNVTKPKFQSCILQGSNQWNIQEQWFKYSNQEIVQNVYQRSYFNFKVMLSKVVTENLLEIHLKYAQTVWYSGLMKFLKSQPKLISAQWGHLWLDVWPPTTINFIQFLFHA